MPKGKKFTAAEKHFQTIIDSKNKEIKRLSKIRDDLVNENCDMAHENEVLRTKLEFANRAIIELNKITNLKPEDIKVMVDKTYKMHDALEIFKQFKSFGIY